MNYLFVFISLLAIVSMNGCRSNQGDITDKKNSKDSVNIDLKNKDNAIGIFEPPDSNYTGDYFEKYPSGVIKVRGNFRFGKKSGKWMYFYPNGLLWSEAFFHSDKMDGESNVYHPNGQLMYNGFYKMDKADSIWTFYDSTGAVVEKRDYNQLNKKKK